MTMHHCYLIFLQLFIIIAIKMEMICLILQIYDHLILSSKISLLTTIIIITIDFM